MILKTRRLVLRQPLQKDLDQMFTVYSDQRAMRFWSTAPHDNRDTTQALLDRRIAHWSEAQVNFQITINDQYVGNAGNYTDNEVGFMLHPDYWRQGILTEAMAVIIPYLWQATTHDKLTADVDPNNAASYGLLRKLGFRETHRANNTFFINGVWSDSVYFALPRPK